MPKCLIDYSNTIIYKIFCKDITVKDTYVGHTTNFTKRKYQHKLGSNNITNNLKIYKVIRDNGGWDNWDMIEIAKYNCKDATEARIKEQEHYESLNTSLNSVPPYVDTIQNYCFICKLKCYTQKEFEKHINSNNHNKINEMQKSTNINLIDNNIKYKYQCTDCQYICVKKYNWLKHLNTAKHYNFLNENISLQNENENKIYTCNCGKTYIHHSSLWNHKKKCKLVLDKENEKHEEDTEICDKKLVIALLKQNAELIEIIKNGVNNNNNLIPLQI